MELGYYQQLLVYIIGYAPEDAKRLDDEQAMIKYYKLIKH